MPVAPLLRKYKQHKNRSPVSRFQPLVWLSFQHGRRCMQWSIGIIGSTLAFCGSIVLFEKSSLQRKLQDITSIFSSEPAKSSKYIFIPEVHSWDNEMEVQDSSSKLKKLKSKVTELKVKYLSVLRSKKEDPWSLLEMTKSKNPVNREIAIRELSKQSQWSDHQYRYIAQMCDAHTLVGLARSKDVDNRFFPPLPQLKPPERSLEEELRVLLSSLPVSSVSKCLEYVTSVALYEGTSNTERENLSAFGGTGMEFTRSVSRRPEEKAEINCLEVLENHSKDAHHCHQIVTLGGLQLLLHAYNQRKNSIVVCRNIARIIGNLAVHQDLHKEILRAGWVTVLGRWINSSDLTLSLHAARALYNLDREYNSTVLQDGVYIISPLYRSRKPLSVDIVFIHGLRGGPFKTWRQQDRKASDPGHVSDGTESVTKGTYTFCWPKDWLTEDCPNTRILSVEYDTELSMWSVNCPYECEKRTLKSRASALVQKLEEAGLGSRPIIWIGHSMGGLLIKEVLSQARNSAKLRNLVTNSYGVIFYGVPHRGSTLANYSKLASYIISPTVEVQEMSRDSLMLRSLNKEFQQIAMDYRIPCLSLGESEETILGSVKLKMIVVPPESSDPGIGEFHTLPTNHLNICKPWDENAEVYKRTVKFIQHCTGHLSTQNIVKAGIAYQEMNK